MPPGPKIPVTVLLSGGIDSAVVAALLAEEGVPVAALFVSYGQPAAPSECRSSRAVAEHYGLEHRVLAVDGLRIPPEGEIVGRNDMLVAAAGIAFATYHIAIGTHAGTGYADCSSPHAAAWQRLLDVQHSGSRRLLTPLIDLTKADVGALADDLGVPLEITYSCERDILPCNSCASCKDRAEINGPR